MSILFCLNKIDSFVFKSFLNKLKTVKVMTLSINDAYALVKNLRSEIIACGHITSSNEGLKNSQKLKIETILQQWTLVSNEASKAAELIEAKRVKTQEVLIRIAADSLSQGEERLAQFLRHAVTIKMLRKSQFEIAKALQQQRMTDSWAQYECKRADNAEKTAVKALTKLNKLEKFLSKTRAATARARAARRVAARAERRTADARIAEMMGAVHLKTEWSENISEKERMAKERYNIDMAIEAVYKAYEIAKITEKHIHSSDCWTMNKSIKTTGAVEAKAIFLSAIRAMDAVMEKLKKNANFGASRNAFKCNHLLEQLVRSIIWCDSFTADLAIGLYRSDP